MTVHRLEDCRLHVLEACWPFEQIHAGAIEAHWAAATVTNPGLFNGDVFVVQRWDIVDGTMNAELLQTTFAAYHYWREIGFGNDDTAEAFATTVLLACDGGVLLARAVAGTLNAGLYLSPGGLLDSRDVIDGGIDVAGAAARELSEETGLKSVEMERSPGFLLARVPPFLGIASVFRSHLSGDELLAQVTSYLDQANVPELEAPIIIREVGELDEFMMAAHARLLSAYVLA